MNDLVSQFLNYPQQRLDLIERLQHRVLELQRELAQRPYLTRDQRRELGADEEELQRAVDNRNAFINNLPAWIQQMRDLHNTLTPGAQEPMAAVATTSNQAAAGEDVEMHPAQAPVQIAQVPPAFIPSAPVIPVEQQVAMAAQVSSSA